MTVSILDIRSNYVLSYFLLFILSDVSLVCYTYLKEPSSKWLQASNLHHVFFLLRFFNTCINCLPIRSPSMKRLNYYKFMGYLLLMFYSAETGKDILVNIEVLESFRGVGYLLCGLLIFWLCNEEVE